MRVAKVSWRKLVPVLAALLACSDPSVPIDPLSPTTGRFAAATSTPGVTSTSPADAPRATTLDVKVNGSGFDRASSATFPLNGVVDPRVHVNRTTYVSATQLVANLSISADAPVTKYDVAVVNAAGKKGIGTEMFTVTLQAQALVAGDYAYSINSSGVAVGRSPTGSACASNPLPVVWYPNGSRVVLSTGTHCGGTAWAITKSGYISGQLFTPAGSALWVPQSDGSYSFIDLGTTPEGTFGRNTGAVNDMGEVVGWYDNAQLYWRTATTPWAHMITPPGATTCAVDRGMNANGVIVGRCAVNGIMNGYIWANHSAVPVLLPRPAGTTNPVFPERINDAGVIAGYMSGPPPHALRWRPVGSSYVVEYLPDLGYGSTAYGIAEDGTISGTFSNGFVDRAVIWWAPGGYQLLGYIGTATTGVASGVAVATSGGLLVAGYQSGNQALRWTNGF